MTIYELIDRIKKIDEVRIMFKRVADNRLVLIFWKDQFPIASVFVDEDEYNKEYPKLFEMNLYDILEIDQALYDFTQTPVEEREIF